MAVVKDVKVGDLVRLKNDKYTSYGIAKGDSVRVTYKNANNLNVFAPNYGQVSMQTSDVEPSSQSKEDIEKELSNAESVLKVAKAKLKWMEETNQSTYNEEEFKIWQILGTLDGKSSKLEKAKAIAAIISK